jgi:hypothetical protein
MGTVLYILWLIIWIPLSLLIVIGFALEIIESVKEKKYSDLWQIPPLLLFIGLSLVGIVNPLVFWGIILVIMLTIMAIGIGLSLGYAILQLLREIIKFVIKEVKIMSDEVDEEIKESKEKKGE